jgi:hypothetical protein
VVSVVLPDSRAEERLLSLRRARKNEHMAFIPTYCEECSRSALLHPDCILASVPICPSCWCAATVVPGATFGRGDVAPYQALGDALREAAVGALNADHLATQIAEANYAVPGPMLRHVAAALPSLAFLELAANDGPLALRKTEEMLKTLLRGIANGRQSGSNSTRARERSGTH